MAELLVQVEARPENPRRVQAGDVVVSCPDGWKWTPKERTEDNLRIIRVDLLPTAIDALTAPGLDMARVWYIDLSVLQQPERFVGPRSEEIISLTRTEILSAMRQK